MSSWSDLPNDILFLIVKKVISRSDFISFSHVCSSWRSIAKQDRKRFRLVLPGIITKQGFKGKNTLCRRFQSLSKLKLDLRYEICLPKILLPEKSMACGSHQGWLVMKEPYPYWNLTLINPISQVQFKLPFDFGPRRFAFSANPMDDNCYITACSESLRVLKCCKLRDMRWTYVRICDEKNASFGFEDAIFYRGKLYALRKTGELFFCDDITASPPMMTKLVNTPQYSPVSRRPELLFKSKNSSERFFLVESGQELLLVYCKKNSLVSARFEVYRLDLGGMGWDRVTNLGEHALFLGMSQSFSLSELNVRGIKGNHIYYIEENGYTGESSCFVYGDDFESEGAKDSGKETCVFSLEKSSVEFLATKFLLAKAPAIWFMPHLDGGAF